MTEQTPQESALEFPCDFPIKAMGHACDSLEITVVEIVRRHAPNLGEAAVKSRPSANGKYLSITVTVRATSKAQLDAIYMDLTACEQVLMAL
jgi:putative lipoic acid-binding regulatory protein